MKKQTREPVPMRTFKFSCRVISGHETMAQIIKQGVDYYNAKVKEREIELKSQEACLRELVPGWADCLDAEEDLNEEIHDMDEYFKKLKSKFGRVKDKPEEFTRAKDRLAELRSKKKEVWDAKKALKPVFEERFLAPNTNFRERANEISRDSSGRVHPKMISQNRPKVLEELSATSHPAWVAHHKRLEAQAVLTRAFRRMGHPDSMDIVLSDVQRAIKDAKGTVPRKRRPGVGAIGCACSPPIPWRLVSNRLVGFTMERQDMKGRRRLRGDDAIVRATMHVKGAVIELSVLQHRQIPDDAKLCRAVLKAQEFKGRIEYYLLLTMEHESFAAKPTGHGTVSVHFGWRKTESGFRAATVADDQGSRFQVLLPKDIQERVEFSESLTSIRDRIFNDFRGEAITKALLYKVFPENLLDATSEWLKSQGKSGDVIQHLASISAGKFYWFLDRVISANMPREQCEQLWNWHFQNHSVAMEQWNAHNRRGPKPDLWEPDFDAFSVYFYPLNMDSQQVAVFWFDLWRRKHAHLTLWANNVKAKALRRRDDFYANIAVDLSRRYGTVVVDDTDFSKLARRLTFKQKEHLPPDEIAIREASNSHRFIVAPSEFRAAIIAKFGKNVVKVKPDGIAAEHNCGGTLQSEFGAEHGTCDKCGQVASFSLNACINALTRAGAFADSESGGIRLAGE